MNDTKKPCGFSIDLASKEYLDIVTMSEKNCKGVLLEGSLGILIDIVFLDDSVLVIKCENGVLRIDLKLQELLTALRM